MFRGFPLRKFASGLAAFLIILGCTIYSTPAKAQVSGATLSGTVTDPSGSVIAGAEVAIKDLGTGIVRTVTTDSAGLYSAPNLIPGEYEVTVTATGFSKSVEKLTLSVGQQQSLNTAMKVGESTQTVTVEEAAPTVELTSATLSAQVDAITVRELPLNGRDWTQLATLEPGVATVRVQASTSSPTTNRANRGFGNQLTDSGHSPYENSYRVDGININDYTNGSPGSVIGANLGTDAIQEFSVLTTDYTAEYGRTSGAIVNSILKSGTNSYHGTLFGFLRNASLDAKNYFDSATKPIPPFQRYQYGGAFGGPIIKDKTFFFVSYEGVQQQLSNTVNITVPSAASRAQAVSQVQPFLPFWPTAPANATLSPDGSTDTFATNGLIKLKENYATAKVDHHFSTSDTMAASWMYDRGPYTQPDPLLNVTSSLFSLREMVGVEETHIFSPSFVNTARVGYNRSHGINGGVVGAINPIADDTSLGDRPGIPAPIISISSGGVTPTASVGSASQNFLVSNSFQFYDDAFWTKGKHSFKFGVAIERIQFNATTLQRPNGQFTFSTLQAFLADQPSKVQELEPGNAYEVGSRNTSLGFYAQDDWKVKTNLSITLGLRYEPVTLPTEATNRFAPLTSLDPSVIGNELPTPVKTLWSGNPSLKNFEPRIGFSWDPFKDGKTAVRGGFGIFDILPIPWTYTQTLPAQFPFTTQVTASGLVGPGVDPACPNGDFPVVCSKQFKANTENVVYVPQNPPQAYAMNWNLNVQRQVTPNLTVTLGYVGSRSIHLPDLPDNINYQLPTLTPAGYLFPIASPTNPVPQLDSAVGSMRARLWDNEGWYQGLQAGVTKNLSHGLQLQGSFTWAKCEDTGSNMAFNDPFQNSLPDYFYFNHSLTKGLCDFNIGKSGVVSFIYSIPSIGKDSRLVSSILGGWQVGAIVTAQSGSPFTPVFGGDPYNRAQGDTNMAYPDLVSGCNPVNSNWKTAGGLHYLNTNCFTPPSAPASMSAQCDPNSFPSAPTPAPSGQVYCSNLIGTLGRNQIVGPGLFDMDFSIFKNFRITERITTQFRVEMFNVLNHPSFLPPLDNEAVLNATGSTANNAGVIDATSTDPRQIQFGLKVNF
jgi:hypothetical protein